MSIDVLPGDLTNPAYLRGLTAGQNLQRNLVVRILKKELRDYKRPIAFSYPAALRKLIDVIEGTR